MGSCLFEASGVQRWAQYRHSYAVHQVPGAEVQGKLKVLE